MSAGDGQATDFPRFTRMEPPMQDTQALIRKCFAAYESKDREIVEGLLSEDFTFSSPIDDNIDRKTYFERCWPNSEGHLKFEFEKIFVQGNEGFVTYALMKKDGSKTRNTEFFVTDGRQIRHVDVYFGSDTAASATEEEIRAIVEGTVQACRSGDVEALLESYAKDMLAFDLIDPLQYHGADEVGKRAAQWLGSFQGSIQYDLAELKITAGDTAAFCHSLNHVHGTKVSDGQVIDMWWRATLGFEKVDGQWTVTHSHTSVPFNMETGQASMGLKP